MMQEAILRGNKTMGLVLQISNHNLCRDQPELSRYNYYIYANYLTVNVNMLKTQLCSC